MLGILAVAAAVAAAPVQDESGFVVLTGKDGREHWLGYGLDDAEDSWPANWEFADGVLHAKGGGADLKTREQYADFDLRFEWKISPSGNVPTERDAAHRSLGRNRDAVGVDSRPTGGAFSALP